MRDSISDGWHSLLLHGNFWKFGCFVLYGMCLQGIQQPMQIHDIGICIPFYSANCRWNPSNCRSYFLDVVDYI